MRKTRGFYYKKGFSPRKKPQSREDLGQSKGIVHAEDIDDKTRYALDYRCKNPACMCSFHFRDAFETSSRPGKKDFPRIDRIPGLKDNDQGGVSFPKTFAKDPSSNHIDGCPFDYERIVESSRKLTLINGDLALLVDFPLGTDIDLNQDIRRGELKNEMALAARKSGNKGYRDFSEVTRFLKEHFGSLSSQTLDDVVLVTQKNELVRMSDVLFSERQARTYLDRAGKWPCFGISKVKPAIIHEKRPGESGTRIECQPIANNTGRGAQYITPTILLTGDSEAAITTIQQMIEWDMAMMVSGWVNTFPSQDGKQAESIIRVKGMDQIASIDSRQYRPPKKPGTGLFADDEVIRPPKSEL